MTSNILLLPINKVNRISCINASAIEYDSDWIDDWNRSPISLWGVDVDWDGVNVIGWKENPCILEAHTIFSLLLPLQSSRHLDQLAFLTRASYLFKLRPILWPLNQVSLVKGCPLGSYWGYFAVCLDTRKNRAMKGTCWEGKGGGIKCLLSPAFESNLSFLLYFNKTSTIQQRN